MNNQDQFKDEGRGKQLLTTAREAIREGLKKAGDIVESAGDKVEHAGLKRLGDWIERMGDKIEHLGEDSAETAETPSDTVSRMRTSDQNADRKLDRTGT